MAAFGLILAASVAWSSCAGPTAIGVADDSRALQEWEPALCRTLDSAGFADIRYKIISRSEGAESHHRSSPAVDGIELGELRAGRMAINLKAPGSTRSQVLWLKVKANKEAWIAARDIRAGATVHRRDVAYKYVDVAPFMGLASEKIYLGNPIGSRARAAIKRGGVLTSRSLLSSPFIKRDAVVDVTIANGPVKIVGRARVLADVYDRSRVHVKLEQANGQMLGVLTPSGDVLIEL